MSARILSFDNLSSLVGKEPTSLLFARYASLLAKKSRVDDAIKVAEEGVMAHPSYVAGRIVLAESYLASGKLDGAIMQLIESIKMEPDNARAIRLLAQAYEQQGLGDKTEKLFTLLNHREPNSPFLKKRTISPILVPIYAILGLELAERSESFGTSAASASAPSSDSDGWGSADSNDEATITMDSPRAASAELDSLMGDLGLGVQQPDMSSSLLDDVMAGLEQDLHIENEYGTSEIDTIVGELDNFDTLLPGEDQATIVEELEQFADTSFTTETESTVVAEGTSSDNQLFSMDDEVTSSGESISDVDEAVLGSGDDLLGSGDDLLGSGDDLLGSGDDLLGSGDDLLGSGDDLLGSGDDLLGSGDDLLGSGDDLLGSGDDLLGSGEDLLGSGEDLLGSGEDLLGSGDDLLVSGDDLLGSEEAALGSEEEQLDLGNDEFSIIADENTDRSDEFTIDSDLLADSISATFDNPVFSEPEISESTESSLESMMNALDLAPEPVAETPADTAGTGYSPATALVEEDLEVSRDEVMDTFAELTAGFADFVSSDVEPTIADVDVSAYTPATELNDTEIKATHDDAFDTFAELAAGFEEFVSSDSVIEPLEHELSVTTEENQLPFGISSDKSAVPELFIEPEVSLASMASVVPNRAEMPTHFAAESDEPDFSHETLHTDEFDISEIHAALAEQALVPPAFEESTPPVSVPADEPAVLESFDFDSVAESLAEGIATLSDEHDDAIPEFGVEEHGVVEPALENAFDSAIHFDQAALDPLHEHLESALDSHIPETITTSNGTSEFDVDQILENAELEGDDLNEFMISSDGDTEATLVGFDFPETAVASEQRSSESSIDAGNATADFSVAELHQILGTPSAENEEMSEEDEDLLFNSHHNVADTAEFSLESILDASLEAVESESVAEIPALPTVDTTRSFVGATIPEEDEILEEEFVVESNPPVEATSHEADSILVPATEEFVIESNPVVELTADETPLDGEEEAFAIESNPQVEVTSHEGVAANEYSEEEFVIEDTLDFMELTSVDDPADLFNDMPQIESTVEIGLESVKEAATEWREDTFDSEPEENEKGSFASQIELPDHVLTPTFADIYLQQEQPIIAKHIYERLLERDPDNDLYLERIEEIDTYIALHPESLEQRMTEEEIHETHRTLEGKRLDPKHRSKLIEHRRKKGSHE